MTLHPSGGETVDESVDETVDLRSDTVTRPSPAMREAIAQAEVGDDSLGDDPTTRALEERVAQLLGKEAAMFFPSGIMANQTALSVLGRPGTEVIVEADAHIVHYEEGAAAVLSGLELRTVHTEDGRLSVGAITPVLRSGSRYQPETSIIAIENTHLDSGGRVLSIEDAEAIHRLARERGVALHLDGARLWHASAASGIGEERYAAAADTVMVAMSKGLGAPVGSLLAGPADLMERAWRVRRRFGGAMRQSGILAAAGLYALEHNRNRLTEDHATARLLAEGIEDIDGLSVVTPETNVVFFGLEDPVLEPAAVLEFLEKHRILMISFGARRLRAVTHMDVDSPGVTRAIEALREAVLSLRGG